MPLTEQEKACIEMTKELWNALLKLPAMHKFDNPEHMRDIHNIQNRIMANSVIREMNNAE